ncbi:MAG: hypothetical protein M1827_002734 [Pycnora praestabilis]|nr:MAG: hypothetical protein M1827_002734 [Pycnora praestabilis]
MATPTSILVIRILLLSTLTPLILSPSLFAPALTTIYSCLYRSPFFNLSTFETWWTVFCYAVFEGSYNLKFMRSPKQRLDKRLPNSDRLPRMRRPGKRWKEAIVYIVPLLTLDLLLVKKYAGVPVSSIIRSGGWDPDAIITSRVSASFLRPNLHRFSTESPLQLHRALPVTVPSSRRLTLELLCALLIYDAVFFVAHLALHSVPLVRRIHASHHSHGEINPQITNQLDVLERLTLVLLANFSLNIIGSHVLTRTLFVPLFVWLLVEIHCGLDLRWGYEKILPRGWGAGAKRHARHHREGRGNYEPFFCWWDDWLVGFGEWWEGDALEKCGGKADRERRKMNEEMEIRG